MHFRMTKFPQTLFRGVKNGKVLFVRRQLAYIFRSFFHSYCQRHHRHHQRKPTRAHHHYKDITKQCRSNKSNDLWTKFRMRTAIVPKMERHSHLKWKCMLSSSALLLLIIMWWHTHPNKYDDRPTEWAKFQFWMFSMCHLLLLYRSPQLEISFIQGFSTFLFLSLANGRQVVDEFRMNQH